jgi:hypothetical protein
MSERTSRPDESYSPRIQRLADEHEHFADSMIRHQEALIALELEEAVRLFEELRCAKTEHILYENAELLPEYAEHVRWDRGGRPELFRAEHDQIYHMMNVLTQALNDLRRPRALTRRAVIDQLDAEKALKGVLEHHALREAFHLFPAMSRLDRAGT